MVSNSASTINAEARIKSKSKSQTLVQLKRMSDLNKLLDKTVITCERANLGRVVAIDNQSMTVIHHTKQEYIIPTYYMREYNGENVVIDIIDISIITSPKKNYRALHTETKIANWSTVF